MFGAKAEVRRSEAMNVVIDRAEPRELCAVLRGLGAVLRGLGAVLRGLGAVLRGLGAVLRGLGAVLTLLTEANLPSEGVAEHWRLM
jgi:hypothetical protein